MSKEDTPARASETIAKGSARLRWGEFALCAVVLAGFAIGCYRQPIDNLDRYIYEAAERGRSQPIDTVYGIVKHESLRAEESFTLDSPQHLLELEPMYTIRPVYLAAIWVVSRALPWQSAINFISAAAVFGTGVIIVLWTRRPLLGTLLALVSPMAALGRLGTPDALAGLVVVAALWLLGTQEKLALGLLFISLGVRTDNILILLPVLVLLAWENRLPRWVAAVLAMLAMGMVVGINHRAGNYGWVVLFRFSFIRGRYPAQIPHVLTIREYLHALVSGAAAVVDRVSIWLLLWCLAWRRHAEPLLMIVGCAVTAHFLLYPSPEDRYLVWGYVIVGIMLIRILENETRMAAAVMDGAEHFQPMHARPR